MNSYFELGQKHSCVFWEECSRAATPTYVRCHDDVIASSRKDNRAEATPKKENKTEHDISHLIKGFMHFYISRRVLSVSEMKIFTTIIVY